MKKRQWTDPAYRKKQTALRRGVSEEKLDEIMSKKECDICFRSAPYKLVMDHDHLCCDKNDRSCGRCLRGVLCRRCNSWIAGLEDKIWAREAEKYLGRWGQGGLA